jgi:glutamine---fructose-6-phosphate transaminase (isomerizing)
MLTGAGDGGATTVAVTNDAASPLASAAGHTLALGVGEERSVAATKTFAVTVLALLAVLADWQRDRALAAAVAALPDAFADALAIDWAPLEAALADASSLFVLGRGPGFAIANEIALKFKETCGLHAESYSAAEVLHGPAAIVGGAFPVLAVAVPDAALASVIGTADRLAGQGADVFLTAPCAAAARVLPSVGGLHPLVAPLVLVVSFYRFVEALARRRGLDPDAPPHLRKVTATI